MAFAEEVKGAWTHVNLAALEKEAVRLDMVLAEVRVLAALLRYPSSSSESSRSSCRENSTFASP
jgi:DNA helicase-4